MIKKLLIVTAVAFSVTACDMFKKDNYDGPDAQLRGSIVDDTTGDLVETDIHNGSVFRWQELGDEWATGWNNRVIKQNGEFADLTMFSGRYKFEFNNSNFFPVTFDEVAIKKGGNTMDVEVTPYIRVKDVNIVKDNSTIRATFKLEAGDPRVKLKDVRLYVSTDIYVGEPFTTYNPEEEGNPDRQEFDPAKDIDPSETYTLTIDLTDEYNQNYFKYNRNYYFRVGAISANISGMGTIRRNYAPHKVITFSTK